MKQWKSYNEFQTLSWKPVHLWYFDVYISDGIKIALSTHGYGNIYFLHGGGPYHVETSPWTCSGNQWIGFYLIGTSIMKDLINCMS